MNKQSMRVFLVLALSILSIGYARPAKALRWVDMDAKWCHHMSLAMPCAQWVTKKNESSTEKPPMQGKHFEEGDIKGTPLRNGVPLVTDEPCIFDRWGQRKYGPKKCGSLRPRK